MSAEHKPRSFPEKILYKGGEYVGLIGGVWYLLNGNFSAALTGLAVALTAAFLGKSKN